ncbi:MAG TPA: hypothetical protein DDZ80_32610 [Cyanobacteria bacterium UBA8803]|nr:hypothetical protein [Cyanobacteria bacterium UBA9273]HBL62942.1 hypothetical protein [Cyanobacteria bacterium UBA8803]
MIRRFLLTSGLMLASAVAFSPKAFAQSVDVPFQGNIGPQCSFAAPIPGTLVYSQPGAGPTAGPITSDAPGGVSGQVDVSCNTGASLRISNARFVSFTPTNPLPGNPPPPPDFPGGFLEARARSLGNETYYNGPSQGGGFPGSPMFLAPTNQTVEVDLAVTQLAPLAGTYEYAVTLTIVP